jgi:hypothetical protein
VCWCVCVYLCVTPSNRQMIFPSKGFEKLMEMQQTEIPSFVCSLIRVYPGLSHK